METCLWRHISISNRHVSSIDMSPDMSTSLLNEIFKHYILGDMSLCQYICLWLLGDMSTLCHSIPHYTILHHSTQIYTTLYYSYTTVHHTISLYTVSLYHTIPLYTTVSHTILLYTTLHHCTLHSTTLSSTWWIVGNCSYIDYRFV